MTATSNFMSYNTLLNKQIAKCLSKEMRLHPEVINLLAAVNNSYNSFEKDISLSEQAFRTGEESYGVINNLLRQQVDEKRETIQKLKETVFLISEEGMDENTDDLLAISSYLNQQVKKREETERFLSTLVEHIQKAIVLEDADRRILYSNQAFFNIFGITEEPENFKSKDFHEFLSERIEGNIKDPQKFTLEINAIFEKKEAVTSYLLEFTDGRIYEQNYIPVYSDEEFLGHLWTYNDVTERQRAHEKIARSEQLLAQSQHIAKIGSWELDLVSNRFYWTDEFFRLRGLMPGETEANFELFLSSIHPDDKQITAETLKFAILNMQSFNIIYRVAKPDGDIRILHDLGEVVVNKIGQPVKFRGTSQDITDQKKAEDEILNQRKFTEDILNNLPADIAVFDSSQNYIFLNPQAIKNEEIRKWLIGKNDFDYCRYKGVDNTMAILRRSRFNEAVESKNNLSWTDDHTSKDGEPVHILRRFHPYFENDVLKFVIGYGVDVSSLKNSEINLQKAFEFTEKTNKGLEQFAFAASHDLQEPLRMVTNYLALIEKRYKDILDDTGKKYIYFAVDGALRMRQIILDLLEFSRIGRSAAKVETVNLNELINDILVPFGSEIEEKGAIIDIAELPVFNTYKVPLRQAFQNLIGNALKYQKPGNLPVITIGANEEKLNWRFSVKDNGIGISQQHFERIFVIFQRLHVKEVYSGTGVGLAITKKIIESIGGKIWVESSEGNGSTFIFIIPKNLELKVDEGNRPVIKD
jgi:PAS domain S-box-containing protein